MKFLANLVKRLGSLLFTPFFYGFVKLQTSMDNLWNLNKPGRNLLRLLTTLLGGYGGTYAGATAGAIAGSAIPIPVFGQVIGAIFGGIFGGALGASLSAYLSKEFIHGFVTIAEPVSNEKRVIEHTEANPDEYALGKSQYKAMMDAFPNNADGSLHPMRKKYIGEVQAIKNSKEALGFWRYCYWTDEFAKNRDLNMLKRQALKDPVKTAEEGIVDVAGHHFEFQSKEGTRLEENSFDIIDQRGPSVH